MNFFINRCLIVGFLAASMMISNLGFSADKVGEVADLNELLWIVKEGSFEDKKRLQQREAAFKANYKNQQRLLKEAKQALAAEEKISVSLESQYEENERIRIAQKELLDKKLGALKELLGHVMGTARALKTTLSTSLTSAQLQGRETFLEVLIKNINIDMGLPSIEDIERLWFEMQREIIESGKVVRFDAGVFKPDGSRIQQSVVRVGTYNLISGGKYLQLDSDTGIISELPKQPSSQYRDYIAQLESLTEGYAPIGIDPTGPQGGGLLSALIDRPTLGERWHQGGVIGYIISAVGLAALLMAAWRFVSLIKLEVGVTRQMRLQRVRLDNPLGRVLKVYEDNPRIDRESLELKLAEAIIKERPQIEQGLSSLKMIAMVAPLMGLLGTVMGMITAFQVITFFGEGDPKAVAASISTALVTTALGLLVAIPTLLLHALLSTRAKRILQVIEQQSVGLIAQQIEMEEQARVCAV